MTRKEMLSQLVVLGFITVPGGNYADVQDESKLWYKIFRGSLLPCKHGGLGLLSSENLKILVSHFSSACAENQISP
jgi:hypothetical protein